MSLSFKCKETKKIFEGERSSKLPLDIQSIARRKLKVMSVLPHVNFLRQPPSNRLEKLSGDRKGQYSIRVNNTYRICFKAEEDKFTEVEIVDYH